MARSTRARLGLLFNLLINYHAAYEPQRSVRIGRWKYICRFDGRQRPVLPNTDDSPSKDVWLRHDWPNRPVASEQLYDLVFDPTEAHNLVGDPSAADVLAEMRRRLEQWMQTTNDPLLQGPIPALASTIPTACHPTNRRWSSRVEAAQYNIERWTGSTK